MTKFRVGDMVRYWARSPVATPELDGYVGIVTDVATVGGWVYVQWILSSEDREGRIYGANPENLEKIELLP